MSKVIFLEPRLFRNNMLESYQLKQLEEAGHSVEIWYLGGMFHISKKVVLKAPAIERYVVKINNQRELKERLQQLPPNPVLFSMLGFLYYHPYIYRIIRSRKDLIWIGRITKSLPSGTRKAGNPLKAVFGSIIFYKLYKPWSNLFLYLGQKVLRKWGSVFGLKTYEPDYLLVTNETQAPPSFPKERVIVTHADDYNLHLLYQNEPLDPSVEGAIVFLDQMLFYHPDFKQLGENMVAETYYQHLNQALDVLSEKLGKPVVVAAHPESAKHPAYTKHFPNKKFVVGKSLQLVRQASLVVSHYSTALNFAVIYNKPVVLLTSNGFKNYEKISRPIQVIAKLLGAPVVNIDDLESEKIGIVPSPDYEDYRSSYIKTASSPEALSYPYAVDYVMPS